MRHKVSSLFRFGSKIEKNRLFFRSLGALLFISHAVIGGAWADPLPTSFESAAVGYQWKFPRDHGTHDRYQTEWWYYTGQLYKEGKRPFFDKPDFGFQLTFFRRNSFGADGAAQQGYLAHVALGDFARKSFQHESRYARAGLSLAGASPLSLRVWNRDWLSEIIGGQVLLSFNLNQSDSTKKQELRLISPVGEMLFQGQNGFSKKGPGADQASMYYSLPELVPSGHIEQNGKIETLSGLAWMDHEFMSKSLTKDQQGWDWFGLMTKEGARIMLFSIRSADGANSFVSGTVKRNGITTILEKNDFSVEVLKQWKSPHTQAVYPAGWKVSIPKLQLSTELFPRLDDQEIEGASPEGISYWEGAVASNDESVLGYAELTGYARALGNVL